MDTFRDKQILDELEASGEAPWRLWKNGHLASERSRVLKLIFRRNAWILYAYFALARIRMTSRLVAAGRCCISRGPFRD